ncbi:MAG: hypothetical protein JW969_06840 [Spirochaetales bacterium]|nr:hypothetical protein [Spirochaetales bacterium]
MKRIILIFTFVLLFSFPLLNAQVRFDLGADIPFYWGIQDMASGSSFGIYSGYIFPFPDFQVHYQFDLSLLKLGIGLRMYTIILLSVVWPDVFAEIDLSETGVPFVFNASVGGGAFMLFGLISQVSTGSFIVGDVSAAFKIGEFFRLGLGSLFLTNFETLQTSGGFGFIPYVQVRFVLMME